jgi:prevent-host-death family protein
MRSRNAYDASVADIPARDLRNNLSGVLRRVEAGERLRVTVSGRPVAELGPLSGRPQTISWEAFIGGADDWRADPGVATELAELLPDTTHDLPPIGP